MRIILIILGLWSVASAQTLNPIVTAFPSLKIPGSSRAFAMGDCGVASATDNQQLYYNAAKTAFSQNMHQASCTYLPWLTSVSGDVRFMHVDYLATLNDNGAFGVSLSYLSLGEMATKDANGATVAIYRSNEYSLLGSYALKINEQHSIAVGLRLLGSQAAQVLDPAGFTSVPKSVFSMSADLSYYGFTELDEGRKIQWGFALTNLGPKVGLQGNDVKTFLPTNLGLGVAYCSGDPGTGDLLTVAADFNKLLVPTPSGSVSVSDVGVLKALYSSFGDTPGGVQEELREIRVNTGIEYAFMDQFFLRGGLSLENRLKGNRKYIGLGAGYKTNFGEQTFGVDLHYLVPFGVATVVSPFQNSWGLSIKISLGNFQ